MTSKQEATIEFTGIGDNDQQPYQKVDVVKLCRIGSNYAISFYQLDYNALANALSVNSKIKPEQTKLMSGAKIVMDAATFQILRNEVNTLNQNLTADKN